MRGLVGIQHTGSLLPVKSLGSRQSLTASDLASAGSSGYHKAETGNRRRRLRGKQQVATGHGLQSEHDDPAAGGVTVAELMGTRITEALGEHSNSIAFGGDWSSSNGGGGRAGGADYGGDLL